MQDKEWVQQLKVGDTVFVSQSYGYVPRQAKVKRLTKTQIILDPYDEKFNRLNGLSIGGGKWNIQHLIQPTEKVYKEINLERLKNTVINLKNKLAIPQTEPELVKLIGYLKEFIKQEKTEG